MSPIILLKELSLLKGNKTVLDVGSRDSFYASKLFDLGFEVDAIDVSDSKSNLPGINFTKISVEDYLLNNKNVFDIVIARHVLHHLENPLEVIKNLNKIAGIFLFTCFGPQDDWFGKVSTLTHEEVLRSLDSNTVRHHSEAFQYGKTYSGETKFWHINTFVVDNRQVGETIAHLKSN